MSEMPAKRKKISKYHRQRAHQNPMSDLNIKHPVSPDDVDWAEFYPQLFSADIKDGEKREVKFADVGCGYGGTTVSLSKMFPDTLVLGMEIRPVVVEYVKQRIEKLRDDYRVAATQDPRKEPIPHHYHNAAVVKANTMKHILNYFRKGQLEKIFFLYADPHFKRANFRRRIITPQLLAEYAYILSTGGLMYIVTDVEDLFNWSVRHADSFPLFERVPEAEMREDPVSDVVLNASEEANKVLRSGGNKYIAVYRRVEDPDPSGDTVLFKFYQDEE